MYADCEGCPNLTETENWYTCERYIVDSIDEVDNCEEWNKEEV